MSKIIQSGGLLGALSGKFAGPLMKVAVLLAKNLLAPLAAMASASAIDDAIQRKIRRRGVVRAEKGITLVIWNEDMDDINRIIKSLGNSNVLIDGVSETVKHQTICMISWYAFRNFKCLNTSKCVNWKRSHESWKRI